MPDPYRWALWAVPWVFLMNWMVVLLATAALTWHRREGTWPPARTLAGLAGGIAANPRMRLRTFRLAAQLLTVDLFVPLALLLALRQMGG